MSDISVVAISFNYLARSAYMFLAFVSGYTIVNVESYVARIFSLKYCIDIRMISSAYFSSVVNLSFHYTYRRVVCWLFDVVLFRLPLRDLIYSNFNSFNLLMNLQAFYSCFPTYSFYEVALCWLGKDTSF